eukprot:1137628-Pelagomonas_calceolata.AAC.5
MAILASIPLNCESVSSEHTRALQLLLLRQAQGHGVRYRQQLGASTRTCGRHCHSSATLLHNPELVLVRVLHSPELP